MTNTMALSTEENSQHYARTSPSEQGALADDNVEPTRDNRDLEPNPFGPGKHRESA